MGDYPVEFGMSIQCPTNLSESQAFRAAAVYALNGQLLPTVEYPRPSVSTSYKVPLVMLNW